VPLPDWSAHLNGGGHVLIVGGSGSAAYTNSLGQYFTTDGTAAWHQSNGCTYDWYAWTSHPILKYVPINYELGNQFASSHSTHLLASSTQLTTTTLLGINCEPNYIAAVREYPSGGTVTCLLLLVGDVADITSADQTIFVTPFIRGYLEWIQYR